jgi:hypothetical protein
VAGPPRSLDGVTGIFSIEASSFQKTKECWLTLTFLSTGHRLGDGNGSKGLRKGLALIKSLKPIFGSIRHFKQPKTPF